MINIFRLFYKAIVRLFNLDRKYVSECKGSDRWVYISYIPEVFYRLWDQKYMRGHQSRPEMVEMVRIFNGMGFNVFVSSCSRPVLPDKDFDIVFGVEPTFAYACNKYPKARKIYYATGAYWGHQNSMIKKRTDEFNQKHHISFPYQRLSVVYNHLDICDDILQIGSKYTIDTYPEQYRDKITLIHQSNSLSNIGDVSIGYAEENEYMWIGGGGTVLKGLDLVIDYFLMHPEKKLHVIGIVEDSFMQAYNDRDLENIIFHGFMDLSSDDFIQIVSRCNCMIYPSCSEGIPGAVINAMYYGLIPIVSPWAATDEMERYGYIIKELTVGAISKGVETTDSLSRDDVLGRKKECHIYIRDTFNIRRFSSEYESYMRRKLGMIDG